MISGVVGFHAFGLDDASGSDREKGGSRDRQLALDVAISIAPGKE
jgi:hypothetical protein